jgi:hypothetical protein
VERLQFSRGSRTGPAEHLLVKHPTYHEKFENLLNSDREAALGEAAVFSLLKTYFRVHPEPADEPGTGGVDFVCRKDTAEMFVVEVTSLKPNAVSAQSGIPTTIEDGAGGPFEMTTDQLFSTVCGKADQMSGYPCLARSNGDFLPHRSGVRERKGVIDVPFHISQNNLTVPRAG